MSHRTSAEIITDSITPYGEATRLTSMYVVFPKMILGERNRHRAFSLSDRSSRAVPPEKLIQEVRDDPAMPAVFRRRTKGMGGGEELTGSDLESAQDGWRRAAWRAAYNAEWMTDAGLAKEIANRPIDPFIRMHSLMTATRDGWLNFFGLRLDAGADPTIQVLARRCFEAYRASTPRLLVPREWHLPFIDNETWLECADHAAIAREFVVDHKLWFPGAICKLAIDVSAARCAHLSYNDLETGRRMTVERALSIYDKLITSRPIHASPCEHQATPAYPDDDGLLDWTRSFEHGNLFGWRQARKMIPGEAVAELPEGYVL